jgi:hypothetical protein
MKKQGYTEIKSENSSVMNDVSDYTSTLALIKKDKGLGLLQSQEFDLDTKSRKMSKEDLEVGKEEIFTDEAKNQAKKGKSFKLNQDELNQVFKDKEITSERSQNSEREVTNREYDQKNEIKKSQEVEMKMMKYESYKTGSNVSSNLHNNNQSNQSMDGSTKDKSGEKENIMENKHSINNMSNNNKNSKTEAETISKNNSIQNSEKENQNKNASASNLSSSFNSGKSSKSNSDSDSDSESGKSESKKLQEHNTNSNFNKSYMSKSGFGNDDPVIQGLNMRVREKQKNTKRRQSCLLRKKSQTEKGIVNNEINPASVAALINKVEKNTPYGRNKIFIN